MVRLGKAGTIILFIISLGAVICALKVVERIEALSSSLEEKDATLTNLTKERDALENDKDDLKEKIEHQKAAFQEDLEQEKKTRDDLEKDLMKKMAGLQKDLEKEREAKASLEDEIRGLKTAKNIVESKYKETEEKWLALKKMIEEAAPEVKGEVPDEVTTTLSSKEIGGKVSSVYSPFLGLELEKGVAGEARPTISVYRGEKLIRKVKTKQIHYVTMVTRVSDESSLRGIEENDQVKLNLLPGVSELLGQKKMNGKIWAVQDPSFLTVALGEEAASTISRALSIYRGGRLLKEMELGRIDTVTIVVEVVDKTAIKGIRKDDRVEVN